ncbi:two-component system, chemotaxis family, CheB/CheR fusion protein [Pedobacter westerhofensis]|uniref:histidine kinase n=1 Tax=Pedobacter westerhofensis TaxID=425512 RepID=A0A521FDF3_9SPHI|nr:CheR family methyltransferase [Pedobacter westerhofensis]SMO94227.1 two-component system, chemotaxis family, CheB/CheR fusion protein [Pedobacter westerhofensis]
MNKTRGSAEDPVTSNQFPVVGIGASAGGLEAISQFIKAIPKKSGMAYVFVQHLSPNHTSVLPEILRKISLIPVYQITNNIHLEVDHFYIIPANKILTSTDGILQLAPLDDKHFKVKIIDLFFSSLAVVHQSYAVGVILSGTMTDGTLGLEVIKAYGGMTFAQDEDTAAYEGMPKSAISSGSVDFVLPPARIVEHLMTINHPFQTDLAAAETNGKVPEQDEEVFKQILTVLRVRRGVDFTYYKPSTLKRRIIRRMAISRAEKPQDYLIYLREHKQEQDALYNDMLISVTDFFRDPASFELFCSVVLPALLNQKSPNESIRIWIAGCATGEEAYSFAICLHEYLGDRASLMKIQIFATDISETAIAKARTGIYRPSDIEGLSPERLKQFFTKIDGNFLVNKNIRDMCVFAHHNLLKDPPFSKVDLISCRNVLIYLEPVLQKRVFNTFHYSLNPEGFLILGKSESIGKNEDLFNTYNNLERIFKPNGLRKRFMQVTMLDQGRNFKNLDKNLPAEAGTQDVFKLADEVILSKYAPAGVLVNENYDIVQFRGTTDTWLTLSPGKASLNLLKMAREGLSFELRNLLHEARRTSDVARKENVLFSLNGAQRYVTMEITPLTGALDLHYLIMFENGFAVTVQSGKSGSSKKKITDAKDLRIEQLEKELLLSRSDMRTVTEDQEAVNEELQSANEELLSGSEELQSLNEELETSKEELQSTNEEINIVNSELLDRNDQLSNSRIYTEAIINTIRDPLIILDKELKVKRATGGFYTKFKVTKGETEGRYFYDLGNKQWDIPALRELLESILPEKKVFADYEVTQVFPTIGRRVMCVNTRQLDNVNGEQLIILAIEDMTDKRKVEEGLAEVEILFKESKERLKIAVDAAGLGTWDYNPQHDELILDQRSREMLGLSSADETDYKSFIKMIHQDDREEIGQALKAALAGASEGEYEKEFRTIEPKSNHLKWIKFKGKAYFNLHGIAYRFVGTSLDITAQKAHDQATLELLKQKDDFISIASHELKTPITSLKASLQLIHRMKDNPSPTILNSLIDVSNRSLEKVSILIEDLLNASRFNQGHLHLNKTNFVLYKVIEDCCQHVRMGGIYNIITTGELELVVFADAERIDQVMINFVNNAIKYAPEVKDIQVTIEKVGNMAKVSVTDGGPGIGEDKLPHLFDRYYRVDTTGLQYSGLGLGLYICAEIVKKNEGEIGVNSVVGEGSTFWFTLPLATV